MTDKTTKEDENAKSLFKSIGLGEQQVTDTLKNKKNKADLLQVLSEAGIDGTKNIQPSIGSLLSEIAKNFPKTAVSHRPFFIQYILDGKITKGPHFEAAINFFKKNPTNVESSEFEKACGLGIVVSDEDIRTAVTNLIETNQELKTQRYKIYNKLLASLYTEKIPFGDRAKIKSELDTQLEKILGPRGAQDQHASQQTRKPREKAEKKLTKPAEVQLQESIKFPTPTENIQIRPELLETHLAITGGKVFTRFPPEPNGYLHVGHAKAMNLNFGYAKKMGGHCYMRFDDTNPETEKQEYIDAILKTVKWLGHSWFKITYASDYFDRLYELAEDLIKRGKAYVCELSGDDIAKYRDERRDSPWRDRTVEENLTLFRGMRKGKFPEGSKSLRMKMDTKSDNPCMWDLVAYRIKYSPHPKSGDRWCIYPTYDFTHCLCDTLENITHSLCTLEFVVRRQSYNWLVDALELYRSVVWEYGRLNLTHTVLSKRRLIKLVNDGYVRGWDDPRLSTLNGYRRRGYTPEGINNFCEEIGVTRKTAVYTDIELLEHFVREHLNVVAHRKFAVLDPIKLTITNWPGGVEYVEASNIPQKEAEFGTRKLPFCGTLFIERSDFKDEDVKDYYGLALKTKDGKPKYVRLKYAYNVAVTEAIKDQEGKIVELKAIYDSHNTIKSQGFIHWVADTSKEGTKPLVAEIRLYDRLFKSKYPAELKLKDDWLDDLNPNSLTITKAFVEPSVKDLKVEDKIQFERLGYFCVDLDSTPSNLILNRTVTLKESKWKRDTKA
eukprot:TRINITY_DN9190_c0_g1_i4.p1 TRINITY_DN9190_c0_g1~~TRINITY_DN9190_c0_g1_i4.p1  ORF type:complete len:778 (+),score=168.07 TRINITY_DN9190_c0_g1_i4:84-2417(+)